MVSVITPSVVDICVYRNPHIIFKREIILILLSYFLI